MKLPAGLLRRRRNVYDIRIQLRDDDENKVKVESKEQDDEVKKENDDDDKTKPDTPSPTTSSFSTSLPAVQTTPTSLPSVAPVVTPSPSAFSTLPSAAPAVTPKPSPSSAPLITLPPAQSSPASQSSSDQGVLIPTPSSSVSSAASQSQPINSTDGQIAAEVVGNPSARPLSTAQESRGSAVGKPSALSISLAVVMGVLLLASIGGFLFYRKRQRNKTKPVSFPEDFNSDEYSGPKVPKEVAIAEYASENGSWPAAKFAKPRQSEITNMAGVRRWLPGIVSATPPPPQSSIYSHSGLSAPSTLRTKSQWSQDDDDDDSELEKRLSAARYGEIPRVPSNIGPLLQRLSVGPTGVTSTATTVVSEGTTSAGQTVASEETWRTWGVDQRAAITRRLDAAGTRRESRWYYLY